MFSVADARRFIAAGLVVIMFRIMHDLPTLHMKSASRVTERAGGGSPAGARGVGAHSGARAHFVFGGLGGLGAGHVVTSQDATGDKAVPLDKGGNEGMTVGDHVGHGHGGRDGGGGFEEERGRDGIGGDEGGAGAKEEDNGMSDSSRGEAEDAAAHVREAAGKIFIPTVPDGDGDDDSRVITEDHPCVVTRNCTHWRDWIAMPQEVLLTRRRVRNVQRVLEDARDEDPLRTRQRFTVEVWDPRRRHNPSLPNKPMHVIPMEATFLHFLPPEDLTRKKHETCAVVGNAGTMLHSGLGPYVDAHEAVVRINYAPTRGFEGDVGTKTTYDLSNKENSAKLGDGAYQWRNSTLLLSEGHSSVVRKNAYRQLVPASLGRDDSRAGQVPRPVRFLSMSLVSMSRFTWFAIKAELEDRINRELQQGLQRSLGSRAADALAGGMTSDQVAQLQEQVTALRQQQMGGSLSFDGRRRMMGRAAALRRRRRRILALLEEVHADWRGSEFSGGDDSSDSRGEGGSGVRRGPSRGGRILSQERQESAESLLASLSNMVDNVPDDMGQQLKLVGQQFKYNPKPMTGMVAVYFALQVCKKVDLYGFQAYRGHKRGAPPYHYFDRRQGMTWVHSFDLAVEAFREMGKHHKLFLRDKENPM